jgi:hypothetical protein
VHRILDLLERTLTPRRIFVGLFILATCTFALRGLEVSLMRDNAVYLYSGERFAEGVPPYVSIFDAKGPMTPFLVGGAIMLGKPFGADAVTAARIGFLLLSSGCVATLFLLAQQLFRSRAIGLLASSVFMTFLGFGEHAIEGPRAKTPMVLFEILSLHFMARRCWFWAALCGALAGLVWQPSAIFLIATLLLAILQGGAGRERASAMARAAAGGTLP